MDSSAGSMLSTALTMEAIGLMVVLQILVEDRVRAGFDADGRETPSRILDILAGWDRMAAVRPENGTPWDDRAAAAREAFGAALVLTEPLMAKIAVLAVTRQRPR